MPFRHLLFNRRNGAPQRAPDAQPISLDSARYFSLDAEVSTYQWPDKDYVPQQMTPGYHPGLMPTSQITKHHDTSYDSPFNQSNTPLYSPSIESPYQRPFYNFESTSLPRSEMMDTDTSSISRSSIQSSLSSTSHVDIMFETDDSSLDSLSRKQSVNSQYVSELASQGLCPLLTGQIGHCHPNICGPDSPCLQYMNTNFVPQIRQCIPRSTATHDSSLQNIPRSSVYHQNQLQRPRGDTISYANANINNLEGHHAVLDENEKQIPVKSRLPKVDTAEVVAKPKGQASQQVRKSRARQAHSLVERKYRENLNAKIQELHLTLKRARFGKPRSLSTTPSQTSHPYDTDEPGMDEMTDTEKSYKVKKSDVLSEAMDYVHATEREMHRMQEEIKQLKSHIQTIESWMRPENMTHPPKQ